MKVSELWLRSFVNPPISTQTWLEQFTQAGIEVDSIEKVAATTVDGVNNSDTIATLKLPPNRGDCLCMEGLAREWAVINGISFQPEKRDPILPNTKETVELDVQAAVACPRYVGRVLQNVNVNVETPEWLKDRLEKAGIRSVSPVVDVTNYVMLELGQPMHAFDLAEIDSKIVVRMASSQESLVTLDGKTVALDENTLVIADAHKPLAIAGILGGENSGVSEKTKNLFLESAYFEPIQTRKTAQRLKLRTESSIRFERGIDPLLQTRAIERATELLTKIVGGNVGPIIESSSLEYLPALLTLRLRSSRIQEVLGISANEMDVQGILTRLGLTVSKAFIEEDSKNKEDKLWNVTVPAFRPDLQLEIDLIEELARIHGYQNIPEMLPMMSLEGDFMPETEMSLSSIKNVLISRGYREVITYSFISPEYHEFLQQAHDPLMLSNPISQDMSVMRESLLPGLLQVLKYNQDRQILRVRCFETGIVFQKEDTRETPEPWSEQAVIAGMASHTLWKEQWGHSSKPLDFFDVKNDIEALFTPRKRQYEVCRGPENLQEDLFFKPVTHPLCHPSQAAEIIFNKKSVGFIGSLHPSILKALDCQGPVVVFELSLKEIQRMEKLKFREVSKYPAIQRDLAVVVDEKMLAQELVSAIVKCIGPLLRDIWIFDVYQGKGIEPGRKSIGFGLLLQHPSRTLVEEEVNTLMDKVIRLLSEQYHAILRE